MSNDDLERFVSDELYWDPKVDSDAIAVSADDGAVTLRGTVGSFRQKREAKQDAERVYGLIGEAIRIDPTGDVMSHKPADSHRGGAILATIIYALPPLIRLDSSLVPNNLKPSFVSGSSKVIRFSADCSSASRPYSMT